MTSHNRLQINRLQREIANLDKSAADTATKEANLIEKINRANDAINRTKSAPAIRSKCREIERYRKELATVMKRKAGISNNLAQKSKSLNDYQNRQSRDEQRARKRAADEERKLMREREAHERRLLSLSRSRVKIVQFPSSVNNSVEKYDFFISHASEDKKVFVRQLAESLQSKGARVWYDEFTLELGDSLRRKIDQGLAGSRFGIVVLSEYFFKKEWPQRELDGLFALETATPDQKRILPIWHKVSKDEVASYSPILADKIALNTSMKSIDEISDALMQFVRA